MASLQTMVYWSTGGSSELDQMSWENIEDLPLKLKTTSLTWQEISDKEFNLSDQGCDFRVIVLDPDTKEQMSIIEKNSRHMSNKSLVFILTPAVWLDRAKKITRKNEGFYSLKKPVRMAELDLILQKSILLEFYRHQTKTVAKEEIEWLSKIEKVFEFSRQELLDKEKTAEAYENMFLYEQHLVSEQKRINAALLALQEFRDSEKIEWDKERNAREEVEKLMQQDLKNKDKEINARMSLADYSSREKKAYHQILKEFKQKGSLDKEQIEALLIEHETLLKEIERLNR